VPQTEKTARIILEDGTEFEGLAFGHDSSVAGEIICVTGMSDMARLLSDPALKGMIVVLSQPVAGITGIPEDELCPLNLETAFESPSAQITGLVVAQYTEDASHWSSSKSLGKWLKKQQVPGISGIDTRALIQRLSIRGTMRAKILVSETKEVTFNSASMNNQSANISTKRPISYGSGEKKIALIDCGVRNSTIRSLVTKDTTVVRLPFSYDYSNDNYDGIFIAGGPGDPTSCEKTITILRNILKSANSAKKPIFATGQGAVILAVAAGAAAFRMAMGHRSSSVPCIDLESGRCYITSQNHGYGIRDDSLPKGWQPTFLNNHDHSIEGFAAEKGLYSGVLFQPEGYPGPHDTDFLYSRFIEIVSNGGIHS